MNPTSPQDNALKVDSIEVDAIKFDAIKINVLEAKNIYKSFQLEQDQIEVLKDISLSVQSGEFVAIMGKSGSGWFGQIHLIEFTGGFGSTHRWPNQAQRR